MSQGMTAPAGGGDNKTKLPVPLLPNATYPLRLVSMVDCGTQNEEFNKEAKKRRVLKLTFEVPNQKAQFYAEDTELKPRNFTMDFTYMIFKNKTTGKKTNLLTFVEGIIGVLNPEQYNTYDLSQLVGHYYNGNVVQYQKKDLTMANKIQSVGPFQNFWPNEDLSSTTEVVLYNIDFGFDTLQFAQLPYWLRKVIKESDEATAYGARGGKFAKLDEHKNIVFEDAAAPQAGTQGIAPKVRMKNPQHIYADFIKNSWTDEMLVGQGYADWVVQTPATAVPQAPAVPQPPAPVQHAAPPVAQPQAVQPRVIMNAGLDYAAHTAIGWTDEALVQHNMAQWNPAFQAPVAAPPVQAPPAAPPQVVAPPAPVQPVAPPTVASPQPMAYQPPTAPPTAAQPAAAPPAPPAGVPPYTPPPPQVNDVSQAINMFAAAPAQPQAFTPPAASPQPVPVHQVDLAPPTAFNEEEHDDLPF